MARVQFVSTGSETTEVMNNLAQYLLNSELAKVEEGCGFQEASYATCDFEIHVVKKRQK